MKILAFSANPVTWTRERAIGGAEIRYVSILSRWYKKGIEITAVEYESSASKRLCVEYPVHIIRIPKRIPLIVKFVVWIAGCIKFIVLNKKENFSLIYAPTNNVSDLIPSILAKIILKRPLVICVQNANPVYSFMRVLNLYGGRFFNRLLLTVGNLFSLAIERHGDLIIAISQVTKNTLVQLGLDESKIVVNGMGVEERLIEKFEQPLKKEYDAVFIGRVEKEKGIFDLLQAWKIVAEKRPTVKLLVIGDGSELEHAKRFVEENNISKNVIFTGSIYSEEKYDLLKKSKVMVYPTFSREGFCLSILDALSCGLPVITYNEYFTIDVYKKCKAVIFLKMKDIYSLIKTLSNFIELNETELNKYSKYAYNFIKDKTWSEVAKLELEYIINKILKCE